MDLCCDDTVEIYDGTATSHTLLETLTSTSEPHLILSASQNVYIKMTLNTHWKCRGVFMTYTQGKHFNFVIVFINKGVDSLTRIRTGVMRIKHILLNLPEINPHGSAPGSNSLL